MLGAGDQQRPPSFVRSVAWVLLNYPRNLLIVIWISVPLMAFAGLVGAAMVEILPWADMSRITHTQGFMAGAGVLILIAAFGTALPVPIAFDVVICSILWQSNVPIEIVAALLVTLGIYSAYPWMLLGNTLSWRVATGAGVAVLVLGVVGGGAAIVLDDWHEARVAQQASAMLAEVSAPTKPASLVAKGRPAAELKDAARPLGQGVLIDRRKAVELWRADFEPTSTSGGVPGFTRMEGKALGFNAPPMPRPYRSMQFGTMLLGGIASGDVNGDGWPDVVIGTAGGAELYVNVGGRFAQQVLDFPEMEGWQISDLALIDLNGDRADDLLLCAWMQGCHVLFNDEGGFSLKKYARLPRSGETSIRAMAFADVDRDGHVDVLTGASVWDVTNYYPVPATNYVWHNDGSGGFTPWPLPGEGSQTLSVLFTELNGDKWPDIVVGNDYRIPDRLYINEKGRFRLVGAAESPIPYSTTSTMSLDTGDIQNDGRNEIYFGQIAMGNPGGALARRLADPQDSCREIGDLGDRARCEKLVRFQGAVRLGRDTADVAPCKSLDDPTERRDCVVSVYHWDRITERLPIAHAPMTALLTECGMVPADFESMHDVCRMLADGDMDYFLLSDEFRDEVPSTRRSNMLWTGGEGRFTEVTKEWGATFGGWTWNAKFADLDNDSWQDLFVVNGSPFQTKNASAIFYRNAAGKTFEDASRTAGLESHIPTGSYLLIDYDRDGDLDLITYPFLLTPVAWRNDGEKGSAFQVVLDDRRSANRTGIGARVEIRAPDGRQQVRDIKAGGGYQSHDEPLAHFGLGDWQSVASLKVTWADGEMYELSGRLTAGRYSLVRAGS